MQIVVMGLIPCCKEEEKVKQTFNEKCKWLFREEEENKYCFEFKILTSIKKSRYYYLVLLLDTSFRKESL